MEEPKAKTSNNSSLAAADDDFKRECEQLKETLPKAEFLSMELVKHQGFWYEEKSLQGVLSFQRNFQPLDTDVFLATKPKCGTLWLKALIFALLNRHRYPDMEHHEHPLYKSNPHDLAPFMELKLFFDNPFPDLTVISSARLFATHIAFESLPESVKDSDCPIIYMCRNPLDAFVSSWHFFPLTTGLDLEINTDLDLETNFDKFCQGVDIHGPFLDHVLGFWNASRERPGKVLFLMYEDVKQDTKTSVKKIAEFLGVPFSPEEESEGKIEEICGLCSFEKLRAMETNKHSFLTVNGQEMPSKWCFRKGKLGDWVSLLSPEMARRFDDIMKLKLQGSGLSFKMSTTY